MKKNSVLRCALSAPLCCCALAAQCLAAETGTVGGSLGSSTIVSGIIVLLNDLTTVLTVLCPVVAVVCVIAFCIARSAADEQEAPRWNRRIRTAIICGVGGGLASGLISLISSYFA